jgi:non-ribosomal peptide synthetase component F
MLVQALLYILLSKVSGQADVVLGTVTAGRRHAQLERLIGMFVNTLALRHQPLAQKRLDLFLAEVKAQTVQAFENQDYPFEALVERLEVRRDTGRHPLFDVMLVLQNSDAKAGPDPEPGDTAGSDEIGGRVSKFDMTWSFARGSDRLYGSIEYCTKLFKEATVSRLIGYFMTLVKRLPLSGSQRIGDLDLLGIEERRQLVYGRDRDEAVEGPDRCLHHIFSDQARRRPDGIAVVLSDVCLAYGQLEQLSSGLALRLRERGAGLDDIIGLQLERSAELTWAILGILKSGCAYLPLDPDYPAERRAFMLADSGAGLLLTGDDLSPDSLPAAASPPTNSDGAHLAYVIYTSGSSGRPKGVLIEHNNVVSLLRHGGVLFDLCPADTWTMFHSACFDFSVWEMYGALLYGGRLVMVPRRDGAEPDALCLLQPGCRGAGPAGAAGSWAALHCLWRRGAESGAAGRVAAALSGRPFN